MDNGPYGKHRLHMGYQAWWELPITGILVKYQAVPTGGEKNQWKIAQVVGITKKDAQVHFYLSLASFNFKWTWELSLNFTLSLSNFNLLISTIVEIQGFLNFKPWLDDWEI